MGDPPSNEGKVHYMVIDVVVDDKSVGEVILDGTLAAMTEIVV